MTLKDKIALIEEHDSTVIYPNGQGYIIDLTEWGTEIEVDTKEELEAWVDYQLAADPAYYGLNVGEFYEVAPRPHKVHLYDGMTGEVITASGKDDLSYIATRPIEDIEHEGDYTTVYISL